MHCDCGCPCSGTPPRLDLNGPSINFQAPPEDALPSSPPISPRALLIQRSGRMTPDGSVDDVVEVTLVNPNRGLAPKQGLAVQLNQLVETNTSITNGQIDLVETLSSVTTQLQDLVSIVRKEEAATKHLQEDIALIEGESPHHSSHSGIHCFVVAKVERLFELNTIDQSFMVQVLTTMRWALPDTEDPPLAEEDDGDWIPEWTPKYRFKNVIEQISDDDPEGNGDGRARYSIVKFNDQKYIKMEQRLLMKMSEPLELSSFPVDCQDLHIIIESKLPVQQVVWNPPEKDGNVLPAGRLMKERCLLNDFRLVGECPFTQNMYTAKRADNQVSALTMTVKITRKCRYYILNVAIPMFLIVSFVFCAWALHPGAITGRQGIDFMLIMTVIFFKQFLGEMLPAVSYLTRLDVYVNGSFVFLSVITIVHSVIPYSQFTKLDMSALTFPPSEFPDNEEEDLIDRDTSCKFAFAVMWGAWNIGFAFWLWLAGRWEYQAFYRTAAAEQKRYDESNKEVIDCSPVAFTQPLSKHKDDQKLD